MDTVKKILFRLRDLQDYLLTDKQAVLTDTFCDMVITIIRYLISEFESCICLDAQQEYIDTLDLTIDALRKTINIIHLMDIPSALQFLHNIIEETQGIYDHILTNSNHELC